MVVRGGTRELRIDGTFASRYTPGSASAGPVWDALAAPLCWLPPRRRRRVLLLGLGGGSAARGVRAVAPDARIVGVEIDPRVVALARRWFDLDALGVEVVVDDARRYLARSRARFDAVLEDVFVGRGRAVHKPDWMLEEGLAAAARRVRPGGLLVSNAIDEAAPVAERLMHCRPGLVSIDVDGFDNRILVAGPARLDARALRAAARAHPAFARSLPALRFRTR